jgi:hypothetical protein
MQVRCPPGSSHYLATIWALGVSKHDNKLNQAKSSKQHDEDIWTSLNVIL